MIILYPYFLLIISIWSCSSNSFESDGMIKNYNYNEPIQYNISLKLKEISGLTTTSDSDLFAINDEIGIVYKLDSENGKIIKRFFIGKRPVKADFEGITIADNNIYVITSNGTLYKFIEGEDKKAVDYSVQKLPFSSNFNIEGLFFDKELNGLLVVAKEYAGKKYKNKRAIYFYDLKNKEVNKKPKFLISLKKLKNNFGIKDFYPSGISKHPFRKTYFILSARDQNVIVELDIEGTIIAVQKLSEKKHRQPEGITFLKDGTLIISDEAAGKKPTLTKYIYKD